MNKMIQERHHSRSQNGLFKRILWLYGLYTLLSNAAFLFGYYLLPEGFLRGNPLGALAGFVAAPESFWPEFGRTLLTNLGIYQRPSWLKWADKFVKVKNWREVRLSSGEILCLVIGVLLVIIGAYRETMMAMNL